MGEPKPIASLSGLLLARKGAARPAMRRPASFSYSSETPANQDDLGWNDMGYDVDPDPNTPMDHDHSHLRNPLAGAVPEVNQEIREQQEVVAQRLREQAEVGFESLHGSMTADQVGDDIAEAFFIMPQQVPAKTTDSAPAAAKSRHPETNKPARNLAKRAASGSKDKAAFTLRLDKDRHLKLRLACAISNRSAQMIVTEALDAFIENMPEIGQLAARIPNR